MDRALLVGIKGEETLLKELEALVQSIDILPEFSVSVRLDAPSPRLLIGSGKAEEIIGICRDNELDMIIFNKALSPSQQRNWERDSGVCVIDRQEVILEIFARRAETREASLQTGLARMEYSLPRLTRAWTHLSRQRGGTKGTRGEGETQLEMDRRIVLNKIARMKKELKLIEQNRDLRRRRRIAGGIPSVCLVGYTNAGKSSLMNKLCNTDVLARDQLFATLDASTRKLELPGGRSATLTDTVGFIRDLPHTLVEAFKSTLEEAVKADLLLHVIDASDPEAADHFRASREILKEIGADENRYVAVFNKTDMLDDDAEHGAVHMKEILRESGRHVFCSAATGDGIEELLDTIAAALAEGQHIFRLRIPFGEYGIIAMLHEKTVIISETEDGDYADISAKLDDRLESVLQKYIIR